MVTNLLVILIRQKMNERSEASRRKLTLFFYRLRLKDKPVKDRGGK